MAEDISHDRRRFLGTAAMTMAAARSASSVRRTHSPARQHRRLLPTLQPETHTAFGALKQIDAGVLHVGYAEAGPADGPAVLLLHGWPYDIHTYVDVAPCAGGGRVPVIVPYLRGYGTTRFLRTRHPGTASRRCSPSIPSP